MKWPIWTWMNMEWYHRKQYIMQSGRIRHWLRSCLEIMRWGRSNRFFLSAKSRGKRMYCFTRMPCRHMRRCQSQCVIIRWIFWVRVPINFTGQKVLGFYISGKACRSHPLSTVVHRKKENVPERRILPGSSGWGRRRSLLQKVCGPECTGRRCCAIIWSKRSCMRFRMSVSTVTGRKDFPEMYLSVSREWTGHLCWSF